MNENSLNDFGKYDQKSTLHSIFPNPPVSKRAVLQARQAAEVKLTCEVIAKVYNISGTALASPTRGEAHVAFARQIAMYLAHVAFGMSLGAVGRHFRRDRTTAAYACRKIEDRRDNPGFDLMLDRLEHSLKSLSTARFGVQ